MRVIIPCTYRDSNVLRCCEAAGVEPELHDVGGDPFDYWRLMRDVWADAEDFILIEHDILFPPEAIRRLEECPGVWCNAEPFFRLVRFRSELMQAVRDAFERIPYVERHWIPLEWSFGTTMVEDPRLEAFRGGEFYRGHVPPTVGGPLDEAYLRPSLGRIHNHSAEFANQIYNQGSAHHVAGASSNERAVEWARWMRALPADAPDHEIDTLQAGRVSWRVWAWTHAPGHPYWWAPGQGPDLPCSHTHCKRGNRGRDGCPSCVENPITTFRDGDGTMRNADGSLRVFVHDE